MIRIYKNKKLLLLILIELLLHKEREKQILVNKE